MCPLRCLAPSLQTHAFLWQCLTSADSRLHQQLQHQEAHALIWELLSLGVWLQGQRVLISIPGGASDSY